MSVIVCLSSGSECACCGGSATLGGTQEPVESARGKAFVYCSIECHDDWEQYLDDQARHRDAAWCPTCGYDRYEHAEDCADWLAYQRARGSKVSDG